MSVFLIYVLLAVFGCGGNANKEKTDIKTTEKIGTDSSSTSSITQKNTDTAQVSNNKNESATLVPKNETTVINNTPTLTIATEPKNKIPDAPKETIEKASEVANTLILDECKRKSNQLPTTGGGLEDLNVGVTELQVWIPNLMRDYSGKYAGPIDAEISQMDLIVSNNGILGGKVSLQTEVASPDGSINPVIGTYPLRSGRVKGALAEWQKTGKSNYTIGQFVSWKNANGNTEYGLLAADSEKKVFTLLRQIK
jgi:hypothetical protein